MLKDHKPAIILSHECDNRRNACEFGNFFTTTPDDLIKSGLYSDIAVAFHEPPFRQARPSLSIKDVYSEDSEVG